MITITKSVKRIITFFKIQKWKIKEKIRKRKIKKNKRKFKYEPIQVQLVDSIYTTNEK